LVKITEACPPLNCSEKDHILPENQCCRVCRGEWVWQVGVASGRGKQGLLGGAGGGREGLMNSELVLLTPS
jgi:hypothetical protein